MLRALVCLRLWRYRQDEVQDLSCFIELYYELHLEFAVADTKVNAAHLNQPRKGRKLKRIPSWQLPCARPL